MFRANTDHKAQLTQTAYRQTLRGLRPVFLGVLVFSAVLNVLMLTGSIYMLQIYDRVLSSGSVSTLVGLFAVVVVLFGFLGFYDFLRGRLLSRGALRLDNVLGVPAFDRWLRAGLPGGASQTGASVAANAAALQDLRAVRTFMASPAVTALADMPFVPLFLAVLFLIHPWLGWMTVGGAVIAALLAFANRRLSHAALQDSGELESTEREFTDCSRRNAEAIFAMGMYAAIAKRWRGLHQRALASAQCGADPSDMLAAASRAFRMLLQSAILTLGALLVLRGEISGGMIIASSILSGRALAPVDQLIGQWRAIGLALAAHRRLGESFASEIPEPQRIDLPDPTGEITVSNLTMMTPGAAATGQADAPRILSGVTFKLASGDALGVVGNSASGKSTLARLLAGAMMPDGGEIRLDGATPDQWDPVRLGRNIGYLPQMLEMLPGSIRDNIARFDSDASDEAVMAAAQLTGIHDMILKLPKGYGTQLCDPTAPVPLSGGQMQRLGLARAVYGLPKIVVLDEPNSNLDISGDAALTRTIETLRESGSTVIVMAHRPSALKAVNKLMVLDAGIVRVFDDKDVVLSKGYKINTSPRKKVEAVSMPTPAQDVASASNTLGRPAALLAEARARKQQKEEALAAQVAAFQDVEPPAPTVFKTHTISIADVCKVTSPYPDPETSMRSEDYPTARRSQA